MVEAYREVSEYREFLKEFVMMQLRAKYRGSLFGFFWVFLTPLLVCMSFGFVFAYVNRMPITDFLPYFLAGFIPWTFFASTGSMANFTIIGNAAFVTKAYVPKSIFPLSVVIINFVDLLAGLLAAFVLIGVLFPQKLHSSVLLLPLSILLLAVFVTGISFLFATLNVFFRDWQFFWNTLSFLWFFVSPILWTINNIPPTVRPLFSLNIMYPFLRMFQDPIAWGVYPPPETIMMAMLYAIIMFILGTGAFLRWQRQFYMYV